MPPPAGPGQRTVLKTHYERAGSGPVAYLDETYELGRGRARFYVMSAVVVLEPDRDPLRNELDSLVPSGWWHTTEELRNGGGRDRARELLGTFRVPDETCVIVDKTSVDTEDSEGIRARGSVLRRLLTLLHSPVANTHPPVRMVVSEEQREARKNNFDRSVRKSLIAEGSIDASLSLVHASPGSEHLLWLPDLVCSAYRQKLLHQQGDLFEQIMDLTHVIELP